MSKELVCDGDKACDDNSDEKGCKCLTTDFVCPTGECLKAEELCDSEKGCDDNSDESRCGKHIRLDLYVCFLNTLSLNTQCI